MSRSSVVGSTISQTHGTIDNFGPHADGYESVWAGDVAPRQVFPGIRVQVLWSGRNGAKAALTTIEPGAVWGGEDHHAPGPEEVFVGSWHVPQPATGCELFLFYPEG